ncbi:hypothetical protein C2S53_005612 [Perilla frutescens var. hirtella]|uniref:Uncharacterized protein n=1 Tax=Perilla frutescens var. hirtella TaxID=608512 RepID=A0AAD4JFM8_PERFH|nr:hypothetical protein C2S51_020660 [Perilla frutescens var. frutescens]KAH6832263.1 hypothetical protein C2S53_005612 [Perilla frutescens var. hirtella]
MSRHWADAASLRDGSTRSTTSFCIDCVISENEDLHSYERNEAISTPDAIFGDDLEPILAKDDDDMEEDAPAIQELVEKAAILELAVSEGFKFQFKGVRGLVL